MNHQFKKAIDSDIELIIQLDNHATFKDNPIPPDNYPPKLNKQELVIAIEKDQIFILLKDKKLIAYYWISISENEICLKSIAVDKNNRRRGIGKSIINTLTKKAEELGHSILLSVDPYNLPAISLYFSSGFVISDYRKAYFGNKHPNISRFVMKYNLKKPKLNVTTNKIIRVSDEATIRKAISEDFIGVGIQEGDLQDYRDTEIIFSN